jgi:hypothetical protein
VKLSSDHHACIIAPGLTLEEKRELLRQAASFKALTWIAERKEHGVGSKFSI